MRRTIPFLADDLRDLDALYQKAHAVVAMEDVWRCHRAPDVIAVRHDVDDNQGSFPAALDFARWEHARGYRSTYFLLHTASYWGTPEWREGVLEISSLGHEVGIHANALTEALRTRRDQHEILREALDELRTLAEVVGVVPHGDEDCYEPGTERKVLRVVNDEQFTECARPEVGTPDRLIAGRLRLDPKPLADFGLHYEANRLPRKFYASDSGGHWSQPWETTLEQFHSGEGQLHLLIHPDWWTEAF